MYVHPAAMQLPDDVTILTNKSQNTKGAPFNHEENEKWTFSLSMPWRHVVGSRDIHPLILNLGNSWEEWSASSSGCFIGGKEPKYKLLWGCVSTRHDLEFLEGKNNLPWRDSNPQTTQPSSNTDCAVRILEERNLPLLSSHYFVNTLVIRKWRTKTL